MRVLWTSLVTAREILAELKPLGSDGYKHARETPLAPDCLRKMQKRGNIGKKRKSAKC